jgi:hypothetical protein
MRIMTPDTFRPNGLPTLWIRDQPQVFEAVRAVWRERECAKINGYLITPYMAGMVMRVYSGMMPKTRQRFIDRPLPQMIAVALEIVG